MVIGTMLAACAPAQAAPAYAADTAPATSKIEFSYAAPDVAETGDHVTWGWTLENKGGLQADRVIVIHNLSAKTPVRQMSEGCTAQGTVVRCVYGAMAPGQKRTGSIDTGLPGDVDGAVQISARVIWQQGAQRTNGRSVLAQS